MDAASPLTPAAAAADARPAAVVAIPARNEVERIGACLSALDAQRGAPPGGFGVLLFLNNCDDGTAARVGELAPGLSFPLRVIEETFAGAHAGWARRRAMDAALDWLGGRGLLLSTDADSRVPPDWLARNRAAIEAGADAVAGRVELIPEEAALLPASLPARGRLEDGYGALLTELEARLDPDPADPWPCHRTAIGASLAVRAEAYAAVGGMPAIPLGEDGAFVARLRAHGLRVRHAVDVVAYISARLTGRAPGGVADTIRARCEAPDALCDARLERVPRALLRVALRRHLRRLHATGRLAGRTGWARWLGVPEADLARIAGLPRGALAVAEIEAGSPRLAFRPVGPAALPGQIRLARACLAVIRRLPRARPGPGR